MNSGPRNFFIFSFVGFHLNFSVSSAGFGITQAVVIIGDARSPIGRKGLGFGTAKLANSYEGRDKESQSDEQASSAA